MTSFSKLFVHVFKQIKVAKLKKKLDTKPKDFAGKSDHLVFMMILDVPGYTCERAENAINSSEKRMRNPPLFNSTVISWVPRKSILIVHFCGWAVLSNSFCELPPTPASRLPPIYELVCANLWAGLCLSLNWILPTNKLYGANLWTKLQMDWAKLWAGLHKTLNWAAPGYELDCIYTWIGLRLWNGVDWPHDSLQCRVAPKKFCFGSDRAMIFWFNFGWDLMKFCRIILDPD